MRSLLLLLGLFASVFSVSATALTTRVDASEKSCFYTQVEEESLKVAFYFAVCTLLKTINSYPSSCICVCVLAFISFFADPRLAPVTPNRFNPAALSISHTP